MPLRGISLHENPVHLWQKPLCFREKSLKNSAKNPRNLLEIVTRPWQLTRLWEKGKESKMQSWHVEQNYKVHLQRIHPEENSYDLHQRKFSKEPDWNKIFHSKHF